MSNEKVGQELTNVPQDAVTNRPAIGLIATAGSCDSIAAAILRAYRHGHHVLVAPKDGKAGDAIEFARQLQATIVDPARREPNTELVDHLATVARRHGFSGLIYQEDPSEPIDYEWNTARLQQESEYCITAVPRTNESGGSVIVGIPAYNEEVGIGSVVLAAQEHADEVVVVDDGSQDMTGQLAEQAGVTVIQHEQNKGKGAAIQTFLEYVKSRDFEAAVLLDGDGQHTPVNIPEIILPVLNDEADLVIGSRYLEPSESNETPRYRRIGQRVLDFLTFGTSKTQVSDSQSGFRALSPDAVEEISISATNFGAESEMIDAAARQNLSIVERPIDVRYNGIDGQTRHPLRHGLEVVTFILYLVRDRHPLLVFGLTGLVVTIVGVLYGIDGILIYQTTGKFYPAKVMVSGFLTIIGVLGVFTGLVLNRISNTVAKLETQNRSSRTPSNRS